MRTLVSLPRIVFSGIALSGLLVLACAAPLPAAAQSSTPVDCNSAGIRVPFAGPLACEKGAPFQGTGLRNTCAYTAVTVHGQDTRNRFLAIGVQGDGTVCQVHDEASSLPTATAFVRTNGRDFSALRQLGGGIAAVTFTATDEGRSTPCFAFQKLGPVHGGGYANRIRGYVCNRDGAPVTDAEIQQLVGAMVLQ